VATVEQQQVVLADLHVVRARRDGEVDGAAGLLAQHAERRDDAPPRSAVGGYRRHGQDFHRGRHFDPADRAATPNTADAPLANRHAASRQRSEMVIKGFRRLVTLTKIF